jgi:hypothetical protein
VGLKSDPYCVSVRLWQYGGNQEEKDPAGETMTAERE